MIIEVGEDAEVASRVIDERVDFDALYMVLVECGREGALGLCEGAPAGL